MQITLTLKHAGLTPPWGHPVYVRGLSHFGRPCILTSTAPCETDATPEALDVILGEVVSQRGSPFCGYRITTTDRFCHEVEE